MKLPKGFGGQGFGNMMAQAQDAMARAQNLEKELEEDRIPLEKGPIKAVFTGTGKLVSIKVDPSVVDPDDVEMLEDLIVSIVRDGFETATELREKKVKAILPNVPNLGI